MSALAPVAASSFAPEERPQQVQAKESRRTGRHEPIRSSTTRIAIPDTGRALGLLGRVAVLRALL